MYEYHYEVMNIIRIMNFIILADKNLHENCPGPRSYHEVQLGTCMWQQMRKRTFKPHLQIYIYESNWQNIELPYS